MAIRVWAVPVVMGYEKPGYAFERICKDNGFTRDDVMAILSKRRNKQIVDKRMAVAVEMRKLGFSLNEIGRAMERDHTSIMNLLWRADYHG